DGVIVANQKGITVSGARRVTLLIAAATSYRRYDDTGGDPVGAVRAAGLRKAGYVPLRHCSMRCLATSPSPKPAWLSCAKRWSRSKDKASPSSGSN
ncbi:hypothetical protein, partial [Clostridium perfringens]